MKISSRAHLIFPYHKLFDQLTSGEINPGKKIIRKGINSAYIDKVALKGIRIIDLMEKDLFKEKLKNILEEKNRSEVRLSTKRSPAQSARFRKYVYTYRENDLFEHQIIFDFMEIRNCTDISNINNLCATCTGLHHSIKRQ